MTFSLVGMCRRTGMFGAAVTTSNMNVGTRCPFAKAGVGAVLTQHRTDNRLGLEGLALLDDGNRAPRVIDALAADGVRYANSFCPYPVCTPSRLSTW